MSDFGETENGCERFAFRKGRAGERAVATEAGVPELIAGIVHLPKVRKRSGAKKNGFIRADNYRSRVLTTRALELGLPKLHFLVLQGTMATLAQTKGGTTTCRASRDTARPTSRSMSICRRPHRASSRHRSDLSRAGGMAT
jgi:hypothetical protein